MKGIKVIDVGINPEETRFGTCELCFSYGIADNPYMVLEFPDGTQVTHNTYYWRWGNYFEFGVDNVVDFSAWLGEQELSDEDVEALKNDGKHALIGLITEYHLQLEEQMNKQEAIKTIEQEKLYTVEIPNPNNTSPKYKLILVKGTNGVEILRDYYNEKRDPYIFRLTESEIKQDFEWAFQFAKPVEE